MDSSDKSTKVLILEDDECFGRLVEENLRSSHIECEWKATGEEALASLKQGGFDLLLLDYRLTDCSSDEFIQTMREHGVEVPFIVMTGFGDERVAVRMMKAGALDYVSKDIDISEKLPGVIENALLGRALHVTQEALQRNQSRLNALINAPQGNAILLDLEGRILHLNIHAEAYLNMSVQNALGKPIDQCFDENTASEVLAKIDELKKESQPLAWETAREGRLYSESLYPSFNSDGELEDIAWYSKDITEEKELEKSYLRLQRMESIGNLASGLAHDFNNILAPIVISAEMVKRNIPAGHRNEKHLNTILTASERAKDIVKQLLTFSRGAEGKKIIVQPKHILLEIKSVSESAFPKNINIEFDLPNEMATVIGDPTQLHQVLLNLVVNARDAMPHGGTLRVKARNEKVEQLLTTQTGELGAGDYLTITVSDTGTGMSPEIRDCIFDPFFTTKPAGQGTGLGLSTSIGLMRAHGGTIECDSEQGRGTTFTLYLPAHMQSTGFYLKEDEMPSIEGRGELILVVDDETAILQSTEDTLVEYGFQTACAGEGTEAMSIFFEKKDMIRAVITDVQMPNMDGVTFIKTLLQIDAELPIIVMTGFSESEALQSLRELGVKHFLTKPFAVNELLDCLRIALPEGEANGRESSFKGHRVTPKYVGSNK